MEDGGMEEFCAIIMSTGVYRLVTNIGGANPKMGGEYGKNL